MKDLTSSIKETKRVFQKKERKKERKKFFAEARTGMWALMLSPQLLGALPGAGSDTGFDEITSKILDVVNLYLIPILLSAATSIFVIWAIIVGIKMAKVSAEEEKVKVKKQLIGIIAGACVSFAAVFVLPLLTTWLATVFTNKSGI